VGNAADDDGLAVDDMGAIHVEAKLDGEKGNRAKKARTSNCDDGPSWMTDGAMAKIPHVGATVGSSGTTESRVPGFRWTANADGVVGGHVHVWVLLGQEHSRARNSTAGIEESPASAGGDDKAQADAMATEEGRMCFCCCCCGANMAWYVVTDGQTLTMATKVKRTTWWCPWAHFWDSHYPSSRDRDRQRMEAPIVQACLVMDGESETATTTTFRGEDVHDPPSAGDGIGRNHFGNTHDSYCRWGVQSHDQHGHWSWNGELDAEDLRSLHDRMNGLGWKSWAWKVAEMN